MRDVAQLYPTITVKILSTWVIALYLLERNDAYKKCESLDSIDRYWIFNENFLDKKIIDTSGTR